MSEVKLKPCPHCKRIARICFGTYFNSPYSVWVQCVNCGATGGIYEVETGNAYESLCNLNEVIILATENWNRRHTDEQ